MTSKEVEQAYGYLFTAEVTDDLTKQLWLNNTLGALTTLTIGRVEGCDSFLDKIKEQAKAYQMYDRLLVEFEKVRYLLQIQNMLSQVGEVDTQDLFTKLKG